MLVQPSISLSILITGISSAFASLIILFVTLSDLIDSGRTIRASSSPVLIRQKMLEVALVERLQMSKKEAP